jgi:hypothetical protein
VFQSDSLFTIADLLNNDWNKMPYYRVLETTECGIFADSPDTYGEDVHFNYGIINTFP